MTNTHTPTPSSPLSQQVLASAPSPCFLIDEALLERNLRLLADVQMRSGAKVLLALKGFALWAASPMVDRYLTGTCASGLYEAMLGRDKFNGEVHVYAPAFTDAEIDRVLSLANHISFNSLAQWERFRPRVLAMKDAAPACGLRINPEHREVDVALYDPCAPNSRLGITAPQLDALGNDWSEVLDGISGLHFHTLCELNADALQRTLDAVETRFARHLPAMQWVNMGGGHHITRPDYDVDLLVDLTRQFADRHGVQVYLEPGEAVGLNTGVLIAKVLDIVHNGMDIAILDTSATAHMPDVLEMPYRPSLTAWPQDGEPMPGGQPIDPSDAEASEPRHDYRLGGLTCLAGDVIGDYSFERPLAIGDHIVFDDMAHYTMVKTTMFNGVPHPAIAMWNSEKPGGDLRVVREFGYADYRDRLS